MSADCPYALAKDHGLPDGWRVKQYSGVKNYFSPTGQRFQGVRNLILELGYTPEQLLAPKRQREDDIGTMEAKPDKPHQPDSALEPGVGSHEHAGKGEELPTPKRQRVDDIDTTEAKPEQPKRTGSTLEPGDGSEGNTVNGASAPEEPTSPELEALFRRLREMGRFKSSQIVYEAVEVASTGQQAAELIGLPPGWEVSGTKRMANDHIDVYYHPPGQKRLRSLNELRNVLPSLPPMLEPGWQVPPATASSPSRSKRAASSSRDNECAAPPAAASIPSGSKNSAPSSRDEECADTTGYTLKKESTKDGSFDILPDDVTSIDLGFIATRVKASGWECISEAPLFHTFRADCDICLHDSGRVEVMASGKAVAERVARLLVGTWLADTDDS